MKKVISVLLILVVAFGAFSMQVSADPKSDIYDAFAEKCPDQYEYLYLNTASNILKQIPVSEEQSKQIVDLIYEASAVVDYDYGQSFHSYPIEVQRAATRYFYEACDILNLTYSMTTDSIGTLAYKLYYNGTQIALLDGDIVKQTGTQPFPSSTMLVLAGGLLIVAIACGVWTSKKFRAEA